MKALTRQIIGASSNSNPTTKQFVPFTQIVNRAMITPFAGQELGALGPIERIPVRQITQLQNEFGTSGERVFKPVDDFSDRIRFVGNWTVTTNINGQGIVPSTSTTDVMEIVFYGTGLNINLTSFDGSGLGLVASIDGAAEGSNLIPASYSTVLSGRSYTTNQIIPVASGLPVGIHTVRLRFSVAATYRVAGFEILNESAQLRIKSGSAILNQVQHKQNWDSLFSYKPAGASARGSRVVVYSRNGEIVQAFTDVGSQLNLASADHTNEEIIRNYHFREFGANRADDWSTLTEAMSSSNRAFTLEDGTTTLVGSQCSVITPQSIGPNASGGFLTFTFVGTGLDVVRIDGGSTVTNGQIFIDGTSVGFTGTTGITDGKTVKIVSGLPYGTHTFRIQRNDGLNFNNSISQFIVYGPKKPTIPAGASEIADYFCMADYVPTTSPVAGDLDCPVGTLKKAGVREFTFVGAGWSVANLISLYNSGFTAQTTTQNNYLEYTFTGTGFEYRGFQDSVSQTLQLNLNGSTNLSNFTTSSFGTVSSWTPSTGTVVSLTGGNSIFGVSVRGLVFGKHTIRITKTDTNASGFRSSLDIITPIHSPRGSLFEQQNTLPIGSLSLSDSRGSVIPSSEKFVGIARGVTSAPTTTSTSAVPMPEMSLVVPSQGGMYRIKANFNSANNTSTHSCVYQIYVNGSATGIQAIQTASAANAPESILLEHTMYLPAGAHKVDIYWNVSSGTGTSSSTNRQLIVREM